MDWLVYSLFWVSGFCAGIAITSLIVGLCMRRK